jgi:hypothetical protein
MTMKTSILRLAFTALLLTVVTLFTTTARANCGGCGGDKKESPSPTPAPSPAK